MYHVREDKLVVVVWRHGFQVDNLANFVVNLKTHNICTLQHLLSFKSFRNLEQQAHSHKVDSKFPFIQNMTIQAFEGIFKTRNMKHRYGHVVIYTNPNLAMEPCTWNITNRYGTNEIRQTKFRQRKCGLKIWSKEKWDTYGSKL